MTRGFVSTAIAFTGASALLLGAQAPVKPAAPQQEVPHGSQGKPTTETKLSGCVRSTTSGSRVIYSLEVNTDKPGAQAKPATPAGPPAGSPGNMNPVGAKDAPAQRFTLLAADAIGLAKHVNHHVEVTARPQNTSAPASPTQPESAKPIPANAGEPQTYEVTALRMISATCPGVQQ